MEQMPLLLVDLKCIFLLHIIQSEEGERKDSLQGSFHFFHIGTDFRWCFLPVLCEQLDNRGADDRTIRDICHRPGLLRGGNPESDRALLVESAARNAAFCVADVPPLMISFMTAYASS